MNYQSMVRSLVLMGVLLWPIMAGAGVVPEGGDKVALLEITGMT